MANYKKSEETKRKILDACRILFYEKGYTDTRYKDIAMLSGINEGLISYHFKKKDVLGGLIYTEVISEVLSKIQKITEGRNTLLLDAGVNNRIFWMMNESCYAFSRFSYEIALARIPIQMASRDDFWWYSVYNQKYKLGIPDEELKLISFAHTAMESELIVAMIDKNLNLSAKQFSEFDTRTELELMKISYDSIEAVIRESADICRNITVKVGDQFKSELIFKEF